jgi:hypothetical protein
MQEPNEARVKNLQVTKRLMQRKSIKGEQNNSSTDSRSAKGSQKRKREPENNTEPIKITEDDGDVVKKQRSAAE